MRIFVTGASGFVGTAVVHDLLAAGHQVLGLARSDASAARVAAAGATVHRGSLDDPDSLKRGAAESDGVIHTAFIHDFSNIAASGVVDNAAIAAMGDALAGSDRPLVVTSALGLLAVGRPSVETDQIGRHTSHRSESEHTALELAPRGVRVSLVRLPASVHDDGDYGFVPMLIKIARDTGVSAYIGDGANRWPAVHRLDAAELYRLAVEAAPAGAILHAVGDEGIPLCDLAAAIGRGVGVPVVSKTAEEAPSHFGWIARFVAGDTPASGARTRALLGWAPRRIGLLEDLARGTYFR